MSQKEKGGGRRSSILKPPKTRQPFMELVDLKPSDDDDAITTETMRSRRVSFSHKKGVALFTSDHGNTIWHNFYEENNKPDLSDSGGAAHFQVTMNSTKASHIVDENDPRFKVGDDSYNESYQGNHDITFAAIPDDDDDEDHCVDIQAMLAGFSKPVERELPNIVFHTTLNNFPDQTEALINYKITQDSSKDPLCFESFIKDEPRPISPGISTHFTSNVFGEHLDYTNIAAAEDSIIKKDIIFNGSQEEMSITLGIPTPLQEIKGVFIKNNCLDASFPNQEDFDDKENKTHLMCDQNIGNNIQETQKPQVNKPTSILNFLLRDEDMLEEDYPISTKRTLPEESRLDDSYILPDKMTKNEQRVNNGAYFTDKRHTILCDQNSSNCDMEITCVNDNIQCKSGMLDSSFPAMTGTDAANTNSRKTIHFYPNDSNCNMSITNAFPRHLDGVNNEHNDVKPKSERSRQSIVDEKASEFYMSMSCMNYNMSVDQESVCRNDMSMTKVMASNILYENNVNVENNQVHMHKRDAVTNVENLEDQKKQLHNMIGFSLDEQFVKSIINKMSENNILPSEENKPFVPAVSKIHKFHKHSEDGISHTSENENKANISIPYLIDIEETKLESVMLKMSEVPTKDDRQRSLLKGHPILEHLSEIDIALSNTGIIPLAQGSHNDNNERKTIVFDQKMPECNMPMTGVISSLDENKTVFNYEKSECNMSKVSVIPNFDNKKKSIVPDQKMPECDTLMSSVIPSIDENKKTIVFDQKMSECNTLMTGIIPKLDENKRRTIIFDEKMPECNMSITSLIASLNENKRKTIIDRTMTSVVPQKMEKMKTILYEKDNLNFNMSMTTLIPSTSDNRKTMITDKENLNCNMSMTSIIPQNNEKLINSILDENNRKTIVFDQKIPECNNSMTSIIPCIDEKDRKIIEFDQKMPDCNMSMTCVIPNINETNRKTILFDHQNLPDCNMSMTGVVTNVDENKRKTILLHHQNLPESNMPMTSVVSNLGENKRKTILFDEEMPDCNMSMTCAIPNINETNRKTILFDHQNLPDCNMSMTGVVTNVDENKRKTILLHHQNLPESNMPMTSVVSNLGENKIKTILFDEEMPDCNMSMTCAIPKINETNRKTILFDHQNLPDCNMSMTGVVTNVDENKRKTILLHHQNLPESNMPMTSVVSNLGENKRKTILFVEEMPDCNMSMTCAIPNINETNRKTILFDHQNLPDCNMSMTGVVTNVDENKRKTILLHHQNLPESNMPMTSVVSNLGENKRKTILFDQKTSDNNMSMTGAATNVDANEKKTILFHHQNLPESNMSMTSVVSNLGENKRKTILFDREMPDCNMSMTGVVTNVDENKRKTILLHHQNLPESNMPMTSVVSNLGENKRKTILFDEEMPDCNMSMTCVIPNINENKRKTILFDHHNLPDCNMSMTGAVTNVDENKRKTILVHHQNLPESNMSMTSVVSNLGENKRKTILFDREMPDCNMSMTCVIPNVNENKRKTILFDHQNLPDCNMSMTGVVTNVDETKRKTLLFDQKTPDNNMSMTGAATNVDANEKKTILFLHQNLPESNMSMTSVVSNLGENKRKTILFDREMPDCNMSMTCAISNINENKRKTILLDDQNLPDCNVSSTGVVTNVDENKRKTLLFDQKTPDNNMSMTGAATNVDANKRKTILFHHQNLPESNMSMTSVVSNLVENKRKTILFDEEMPDCDMSMTCIIPKINENKRKTILLDDQNLPDCNVSSTGVVTNVDENKRKTLLFDQKTPDNNMSTTGAATNVDANKRKTILFHHQNLPESNMSMTSVVSNLVENKRKTILFDEEMPDCNMSMTCIIPKINENKRKTILLDHQNLPDCNMSMTGAVTNVDENKKKPIVLDQKMADCNMLITSVITNIDENNRRTIMVDQKMPECSMSMTSLVPSIDESKRKTILFDKKLPECNISITSVIPNIDERKTIVLNQKMPDYNLSKTSVIQSNDYNKTKDYTMSNLENSKCTYIKSTDCSVSMTDLMPRNSNWDGKNNETSTSFTVYNPDINNLTRSIMFDQKSICEKLMMKSNINYGPYRNVGSTENDFLMSVPDEISLCDMSLPSIEEAKLLENSSNSQYKVTANNTDCHMSVDKADVSLVHAKMTFSSDEKILPCIDMTLHPVEVNLPSNEVTLPCMVMTLPHQENAVPPAELVLPLNEITVLPVEVPSTFVDVTIPDLETAFHRVEITLPPVEVILPPVEARITTVTNNLSDNVSMDVYETVSTRDLTVKVENSNNSGANFPTILKDKSYCNIKNQSRTSQNCSIVSNDLVSSWPCEVAILHELISNPNLKLTIEKSDSSQILTDRPEMKKIGIVVNPLEKSCKRKSDDGYNDDSFNVPKKQKVLPPVCSWLKDITLDENFQKINVSKVDANISQCKHDIIDTMTYTVTTPHFINKSSGGIVTVESESKIETSENIEKESNHSDYLIANISDMSLVSSSFDGSDPKHHLNQNTAEEPTPRNEEGINIRGIIDSGDEIIRRQCGLPSPQKERKSFGTPVKQSLSEDSLCKSMDTSIDSLETFQKSPEKPILHPKFIPIPTKQIVEELTKDLNLNVNLCTLDLEYTDGNECVFFLMRNAIKVTVVLQAPISVVSSVMRPVQNIVLEAMNVKYPRSDQKFHCLAVAVALQRLDVTSLRNLCRVSGDIGNLLVWCSKVAAEAWSWSHHCFLLYVKHNLQFENDRWTFEICNGLLLSVWEVEVCIPLSSLPCAKPEDVKITLVHGNPSIKDSDFKCAIGKISSSWHYIPNLISEMNKLIVSRSKS